MRDNDREAYEEFFNNFGRGLKYGIYTSYGMNKDDLGRPAAVLFGQGAEDRSRLPSTPPLLPEGQEAVYYAAGESVERLAKMPIVTHGAGPRPRRAAVHAGRGRVLHERHGGLRRARCRRPGFPDRLAVQERGRRRLGPGVRRGEEGGGSGRRGEQGPVRGHEGSARRQGGEGGGIHAPDRRPGVHHGRRPAVAGDGEDPLRHAGRRRRGEDASACWK